MGIHLALAPGTVAQTVLPPLQIVRYRDPARANIMIQLAQGLLVVNLLPTYPGWQSMRTEILSGWESLVQVTAPARINFVGLRYINLLPLQDGEAPGAWLAASKYLSSAFLESPRGRFQSELHPAPDRKVEISATHGAVIGGQPQLEEKGLILDVSIGDEAKGEPMPCDLERRIEPLHDLAWDVFATSRTARLNEYLEGR